MRFSKGVIGFEYLPVSIFNTIQEFTICLNISIIHLTEKLKFIQKPFIKINGMLKEINF
jgi:hypothetical protein